MAPDAELRAWWAHKQGLDGSLAGSSPSEILARTGWARSVGGAAPYLTLFSRGGFSRAQCDAALADLAIHELPAARGCTYVVPAQDFALALKVGQSFAANEVRVAAKLGVTDAELGKLGDAVRKSLVKGPLDTDAIREAVGSAARSLGPEGVKKGITTTLPVALGTLQAEGVIRRIPMNGRLDQQRYKYALWNPSPLAKDKLSSEQAFAELARRYFSWTGGASLAEFQWFSGSSVKAAKAAVESLRLEPVAGERLMLPEDRESFEKFQTPKRPQCAVVSSLDGINQLRRELRSLVAEEDWKRPEIQNEKSVIDLPAHSLFDRGRLIGLWVFDPETNTIAWMSFVKPDGPMRDAVARMEVFVRDDLGDARSFSLDSPKSRVKKIAELRKAASA
ncbi:MAG TPA: crosslink repair DNA glycosylase YcaQ family protein [Bryobacteraceae bacterium]|nr:crosslink repair DNA glycosylase YcaQ family protein [Bryobacteraceae bacterium]